MRDNSCDAEVPKRASCHRFSGQILFKGEVMKAQLQQFWNDEDGATAIEYGLIAGLIAVAIIGVLGTLSGKLTAMFDFIGNSMPTAANQSGGGES